MRKIIILLSAVLITAGLFAQAPNLLSYQTVIRNGAGSLVANQSVGIKISVLQGTSTGTAVFAETQTVTTNTNGLASLAIGSGTAVTGTLAGIDWTAGPYFIKTETDPSGGASYSITGVSQLLSVPYALNAGNGNWTKAGNDIYNSNTGAVGIGTTTPSFPLEVVTPGGSIAGFKSSTPSSDALVKFGPATDYRCFVGYAGFDSSLALSTYGNYDIAFGSNNLTKEIMHMKANGNIGIGTTNPQEHLNIVGGGLMFQHTSGGYSYTLSTTASNTFTIQFGSNAADFTINGSNLLLGQAFASGGPRLTSGTAGDGSYSVGNSWTTFSDERFKSNIETLDNAQATLNQLRGVTYNWKKSGLPDVGFIAQEVEKVIPAIVHTDDKTGYKSVDYARIVPFLVEALNAQQKKIDALSKALDDLKTK